jgi:Spy/CpxP family protein refolding chaperone
MSRFVYRAILLAVVLLALGGAAALAQFREPRSSDRPSAGDQPAGEAPQLAIPGFLALGAEHVQKELALTSRQRRQLREISDRYQAKVRDINEALQRLSPEERELRLDALRERTRKDIAAIRKQVVEVLTPRQLESYETIDFRSAVPAVLVTPRLLDVLGATDGQKARLRQLRDDIEVKFRQVQEEATDKTLQILTPRQQQKLKEEFKKGS